MWTLHVLSAWDSSGCSCFLSQAKDRVSKVEITCSPQATSKKAVILKMNESLCFYRSLTVLECHFN